MARNSPAKDAPVNRLHLEAVSLFGRRIVQLSKKVSIEDLEVQADQVAEAARQLIEQGGQPDRQRAIIRCMDDDTTLALCKWIIDPQCMTDYIARESH